MSITGAFMKAFTRKAEQGWEKIYVLVDVHDTIMKGMYSKDEPWLWYDWARLALKMMSVRDDICLILWTGSHVETVNAVTKTLEKRGIYFDYINENPEVKDTDFYCGDRKIYFNVGIDDKFGFEPETDWKEIVMFMSQIKNE